MRPVQKRITRDALLTEHDHAVPRIDHLLRTGSLLLQRGQFGIEAASWERPLLALPGGMTGHPGLVRRAVRLTPLWTALVATVQVVLHRVAPLKSKAVIAMLQREALLGSLLYTGKRLVENVDGEIDEISADGLLIAVGLVLLEVVEKLHVDAVPAKLMPEATLIGVEKVVLLTVHATVEKMVVGVGRVVRESPIV